ncbi:helix-turn-helix domain-containing protein [Streptomyces sp. CA-135486]|uniref:helix-turn-helix domain-containing protein n=1 Tax=Streptomyces sp. CA-135486 TaxID=3240049 RepID=UPI003D8BFC13
MALRARIVLWSGEGRRRKDIAELAGVAPLTVDRCKARYAERGLAGLEEKRRGGPRTQVPPRVRARVIALTRMSPPAESGPVALVDAAAGRPSEAAGGHLGVLALHRVWREENLKPHRSGTFKISKDPAFAEKVADVVGLYLAPPDGAVVLSIDDKTQYKPWTGPSQCCRWTSRPRRGAPATIGGTAPRSRAERHER